MPKTTVFTCPVCTNSFASTAQNPEAPTCSQCGAQMVLYSYTEKATSREHVKRIEMVEMTVEEILRREG
jgi:hypothetical protein